MGITTGTALLAGGLIGGATSLVSGVLGANAATTAANEEVSAEQSALNQIQANQAPFLQAGTSSISQVMQGLQSGKFGPGSIPAFQAPTLAQVQQYPGYQFEEQAGDQGILAGAAATGGNINGGTLKSLAGYNTNLANTTYGNLFNQYLQTYSANLQGQQQGFLQLLAPAQIGEGATANTNASISQLMSQIGGAQAAGTVGSANALTSGITGASNSLTQSLLLSNILGSGSGSGGGAGGSAPMGSAAPPPSASVFNYGDYSELGP